MSQLSLSESQIAALVVDENVGPIHINIDILRQFKLTNRLACKILSALCELNTGGNGSNNTSSNSTINGQQPNNGPAGSNQRDLVKGDLDICRRDSSACTEEIDLFAEYCRQNSINLQQLLQTYDDEDFMSDRLFRNTNFVLQGQKYSSVPPLASFRRFWQFCTNLAQTDKNGLYTVGRVFFTQVWEHNQGFQLNFIMNCIEQNLISRIFLTAPQVQANMLQPMPNLSQFVPYSELLKCQPDFEAQPELNNWKFQRLYQILIDFTVPGNIPNLQMSSCCYARVLEIFDWPLQYCPDLTVLGLLRVTGQASAAKVEILSSAIPTFLNASHPNAAIILHSIWSNDSHLTDPTAALTQHKPNTPLTWSQQTLLQALSDHYTKSNPEEQQQRLSRVLDVAQDIKTLFRLLDGTCYPFVIDLACLASRREYLKLDKWLMDKFTENGENFIRALNSFLTKRYLPLLNRSGKDSVIGPASMGGPPLPAETLAVMLTFLQQCVMPPSGSMGAPFAELSQTVKNEVFELVGNSSILLQRAPRHPPPGVVTSMANEFNRADRISGFPIDRPAMTEVEKLQAEFEAKRMAQRTANAAAKAHSVAMAAPVTRPSIANNANIDNLLAVGGSENHPVPPEVIQDKVFFIVNNLSLLNLKQKAEEFKELFGNDDTYYGWTAQYFSTKRAALEQNFQPLYANFLYELKNPKLIEAMTRVTYKNIKHLLRLDKKADNINERTVLKNLGQWLGLLTLARNKPILHVDLDLKGLLVEAYHKGTQELLYVVPFLAEILKTTQKSKIFKPNNPFVLGLLRALVELRQQPNLKLNLEFQVEVLFNYLGVDLNKLVGQSNILNDEKYYARIEPQLGTKQISGQQPLLTQSMKAQMQQQNASQIHMNSMAMRPGEFGATSLSPLNTPPSMSLGGANVGSSLQAGAMASPANWSSKFKYSDLDVTNVVSFSSLISFQSVANLFALQPNLKSAVRPAIEQAMAEWLPSIMEKSLKICLPTVEQIIKKDFALDSDENHMQRAAHCLVRHLVSYMAMILCRDPEQVEQSLANNLKVGLARACPSLRKEQAEQAAAMITADNLELARAFIIKTTIERALVDIDKLLQTDYEVRRAARLENHRYFDPECLALHTKLINEGMSLKVTPAEQIRNYEEIGQNIAGFKRFDLPFGESVLGTTSPFNDIGQSINLQPIVTATSASFSKASPINTSGLGANMVNQLISNRVITPNQFATQQIPDFVNINKLLQNEYEIRKNSRVEGHQYFDAEQLAFQTRLINENMRMKQGQVVPEQMRNFEEVNQNLANFKRFDMPYNESSLGTTSPFNELGANMVNQLMSNRVITPNQFANQQISGFVNSMQSSNNSNNLLQQREAPEGDPPGLVDKTEKLLREWVGIHQTGQSVKMFPVFVQQMTAHGILKTDDLVTRFFRLSTEMCVESCYRLLASAPNGRNSLDLRNKCYETLDAFTMLIVLLIKNSGSSPSSNVAPEPMAKINLLSKILSIIANVAMKDQESRQTDFQHLAYYRILILLFIELNLSPPMLGLPAQNFNNFNQIAANVDVIAENVQYHVLNEFFKTLKALKPSRAPSFAFAWLDFLSHRLFIDKCLNGSQTNRTPNSVYKGWALYAQLLTDLIKFEAPFLRNVELPQSVDLLYKGTLKMFLVLLHDFPEFLCEYCYTLCDVIPCNAIQLRNLVLSAFPRKMRLPDPFTPNLKIDTLAEMSQPPKTASLQVNMINSVSFKDELDSFLRTRTPVSFLNNLTTYLRLQNQYSVSIGGVATANSLNIPMLNALVLYVGQSAISAIAPRQISMATLQGTSHIEIFQHLITTLDTEGRYLFLNAIANQLRYPNSHTHYFSSAILYLFAVAASEQIQEQITRVLVERLIIMRPHPWGLLVTFIELIKNPIFKFWQHDFVRCAPEIEK